MIDLHTHSTASDGTDTPGELSRKVREAGIEIFALTDHDTITGAMSLTGKNFVRGIEFSCRTENSRCHILGMNYDPENAEFQEALHEGERLRRAKFYRRIEFLRDTFSITFTPEEISQLESIPGTGKPHLANMIVSKGLAHDKQEAITRYIDKCRTGNSRIDAGQAISAIISAGGVPVWAHPLGGEGERTLTPIEFMNTLDELMNYGLEGLECWYSKYELAMCERLAEIARVNGLYVSGGSDYHGTNKNIPLGKLNAENITVDNEKFTILKRLRGE